MRFVPVALSGLGLRKMLAPRISCVFEKTIATGSAWRVAGTAIQFLFSRYAKDRDQRLRETWFAW